MWWIVGFIVSFVILYNIFSLILTKILKEDYVSSQVGSFVLALIVVLSFFIIDMSNQKYEYYNTRTLSAMQDSQSYVISRYDVESELKYLYMYKTGDDTYRASQAPSNRSTIHISTKDYRVEIYKEKKKIKFFNLILPKEYVDGYRYDFYIPQDGIISEFKVDLK